MVIIALAQHHDRQDFDCGVSALNHYFREQVTQDIKRLVANCFVALAEETIIGFYTLSSASIPVVDVPEATRRRLPRYPALPAIRIGRLAVDKRYQGRGLGGLLLADAAKRALRAEAPGFALVVEAKGERSATFYRHFGFIDLPSRPGTMFLPLATVKQAGTR